MKRHIARLAVTICLLSTVAAAAEDAKKEGHPKIDPAKGWKKLVPGKVLAGWKALGRGKVDKVIEEINSLCTGRNAKAMATKRDYFEDRKHLMAYRKLRKEGIPIGSGSIESAIRRIINLRLKGPGIFWREENAEAMLYLRAHLKAGRWDEMVKATFANVSVAA